MTGISTDESAAGADGISKRCVFLRAPTFWGGAKADTPVLVTAEATKAIVVNFIFIYSVCIILLLY